jgi:hypothetical protein
MAAPKSDPPKCDLLGCGMPASTCSDGSERDTPENAGSSRTSVPGINTCDHHVNFPFSDDARRFAQSEVYQSRMKVAVAPVASPSASAAKK